MDAILETRNVKQYYPVTKGLLFSKTLAWIKAVDGVDLRIKPGETLGILGESGCGKTTLSRLILMLEKPTDGSIIFEGKDTGSFTGNDLKHYRKCVQAVFQNPLSSLDPRMHVRSIISETITALDRPGKQEIRDRVANALQSVGLDSADADKYPHEFSGGQRQRVAIARALISEPRLIILDEPISSQDVSIRAQLMNILKNLQAERGMSYLFIAHDLATVKYMSHRICVMYLGKIVESGPSRELSRKPLHPYTKALLSASLPDHPDAKGATSILSGEVPSPINPPTGCAFHTRCPDVSSHCSEMAPQMREVSPGRFVACLKYQ